MLTVETILDLIPLISVLGIIFEILGFILLLRYLERPKLAEAEQWEKERKEKHGEDYSALEDRIRGVVDVGNVYDADDIDVPKRFWSLWQKRRKFGILLVIVGLAVQILQIILSLIF